jgi:hypothetical protein
MTTSQAEFDNRRQLFLESVALLSGALTSRFPDGYIHDEGKYGPKGTAHEEPMHAIVSRLRDVLHCSDRLQEGLGLPHGEEPAFRHFLTYGSVPASEIIEAAKLAYGPKPT